jgi:hypothetical protein
MSSSCVVGKNPTRFGVEEQQWSHKLATVAMIQFLRSTNIASAGLIHVCENDASGANCRKSEAF